MTNKESKLETKSKEYTWKTALIPFSCIFKKYINQNKETNYIITNAVLDVSIIGLSIFYLMASIGLGSLNPSNWLETRDQRMIQRQTEYQIQKQNSYRNQFQELDKSEDGIIDSTEFIYRK